MFDALCDQEQKKKKIKFRSTQFISNKKYIHKLRQKFIKKKKKVNCIDWNRGKNTTQMPGLEISDMQQHAFMHAHKSLIQFTRFLLNHIFLYRILDWMFFWYFYRSDHEIEHIKKGLKFFFVPTKLTRENPTKLYKKNYQNPHYDWNKSVSVLVSKKKKLPFL